MKIRLDYVSNSSSSSYVIELDRPIEEYTLEEFKSLFTMDKTLNQLYKQLKTTKPKIVEKVVYNVNVNNWDGEYGENAQRLLNEEADGPKTSPITSVFSYQ